MLSVRKFYCAAQEQFVDFHEDLLLVNLGSFNKKLAYWSNYSGVWPCKGLGLRTFVQYIINHNQKHSLWWTRTGCCFLVRLSLHSPAGLSRYEDL